MNGGTCRNTSDMNYVCQCRPGYFGTHCGAGYNPCAATADICSNGGTCYNTSTGNRFVCACAAGYYGDQCASFDPCSRQPCLNGARCRKLTNKTYACDCASPMYGSNCQNFDFCDVGICQNGALSCQLINDQSTYLDVAALRNISVRYGHGIVADVRVVNSYRSGGQMIVIIAPG